MCPTPDSTLADPHQINADLQRQLVECRAERDEALARETAMAEVLQVINSQRGVARDPRAARRFHPGANDTGERRARANGPR